MFCKLHNVERKLIEYSGLKEKEDYKLMDIPLNDKYNSYMHCIVVGDDNNPPLLMVHGYGGGSALFYKLFKRLSEKF